MERGVRDGSRLEGDSALGIRVLEQLEHPVVGTAVGRRELVERERRSEPTAQTVDYSIRAFDELPVPLPVATRLLQPTVSVSPLLACELEVKRHRPEYSRTTATTTVAPRRRDRRARILDA